MNSPGPNALAADALESTSALELEPAVEPTLSSPDDAGSAPLDVPDVALDVVEPAPDDPLQLVDAIAIAIAMAIVTTNVMPLDG
jgi:hypothetical protein